MVKLHVPAVSTCCAMATHINILLSCCRILVIHPGQTSRQYLSQDLQPRSHNQPHHQKHHELPVWSSTTTHIQSYTPQVKWCGISCQKSDHTSQHHSYSVASTISTAFTLSFLEVQGQLMSPETSNKMASGRAKPLQSCNHIFVLLFLQTLIIIFFLLFVR